jgi:hypothetical protein
MLSIRDVVIDPELECLLRPLNEDESNKLTASILRGWTDESIKVWLGHNLLIDGHNRFKVWQTDLNSDPDNAPNIVELPFESIEDVKVWMVDNQLQRRNLNPAEVIQLMLLQSGELQKIAKRNLSAGGQEKKPLLNLAKADVAEDIAKKSGISRANVVKVKKVLDKGTPQLQQKMLAGDVSIHAAHNEVKQAEQQKTLNGMAKKIGKVHSEIEQLDNEIALAAAATKGRTPEDQRLASVNEWFAKNGGRTFGEGSSSPTSLKNWFETYGKPDVSGTFAAAMLSKLEPNPKIYGGTAHHRSFKSKAVIMKKGSLTR